MTTQRLALTLLSLAATTLITACGGGDDPAADPPTDGGGGSAFTATCDTTKYVAGSVELPTAAQLDAYDGTFNGDEGSYNMSGVFTKASIDKVAGPFGKIMYFLPNDKGHFDVADKVDATLGQAWGVSPVDGTTIFTNGLK